MRNKFLFGLIADLVAIFHGVVTMFFASGFIFGILLGRGMPNWYYYLFLPAVISMVIGHFKLHECWVTSLEKYFISCAGQKSYEGSFILHYMQRIFKIRLSPSIESLFNFSIGIILGFMVLDWLLSKPTLI